MKKIFLIVSLVLLISIPPILYGHYYNENIRNEVLTLLEKNIEFCEIIEDKIWFDERKFWMICNGRPFYAEYENEVINYELNGWGFLEENILNGLNNCEFYKSEETDGGYNLYFYCVRDGSKVDFKIFSYSNKNLKLNKKSEGDFVNLLKNDIITIYPFLSDCNLIEVEVDVSSPFKIINYKFQCDENVFVVRVDLSTFLLNSPMCVNPEFSNKERIEVSVKNSFKGCDVTTGTRVANVLYDDVKMALTYDFNDLIVTFSIRFESEEEVLDLTKKMAKYFLIPPLSNLDKLEVKNTTLEDPNLIVMYNGKDVIIAQLLKNGIINFYKRREGFREIIY